MSFLEIFALLTGLIFVILEVFHSRWMWPFEIVSCTALLLIYVPGSLWGSAALQTYYIIMAVIGIYNWKADATKNKDKTFVLNRLRPAVLVFSAVAFMAGGALIVSLLKKAGDASPLIDGIVTILSIIGTWWLTKSYIEQWFIWIASDIASLTLCLTQMASGAQDMLGPALLYVVYTISSFVGLAMWKKKGKYSDDKAYH